MSPNGGAPSMGDIAFNKTKELERRIKRLEKIISGIWFDDNGHVGIDDSARKLKNDIDYDPEAKHYDLR